MKEEYVANSLKRSHKHIAVNATELVAPQWPKNHQGRWVMSECVLTLGTFSTACTLSPPRSSCRFYPVAHTVQLTATLTKHSGCIQAASRRQCMFCFFPHSVWCLKTAGKRKMGPLFLFLSKALSITLNTELKQKRTSKLELPFFFLSDSCQNCKSVEGYTCRKIINCVAIIIDFPKVITICHLLDNQGFNAVSQMVFRWTERILSGSSSAGTVLLSLFIWETLSLLSDHKSKMALNNLSLKCHLFRFHST